MLVLFCSYKFYSNLVRKNAGINAGRNAGKKLAKYPEMTLEDVAKRIDKLSLLLNEQLQNLNSRAGWNSSTRKVVAGRR